MTKKQLRRRLRAYEDALALIWKLEGGDDHPSYVAGLALARHNKRLYEDLEGVPYSALRISKKGRIRPARTN